MSVADLAFALYGRRAGIIERRGGRTTLRYDDDYLSSRNPTPLSLSMPLADVTYTNRPVEAYLRGLLPDHAGVRERWARAHGVRPGDTLGLIAAIGRDCPGGAVFAPPAELEDAVSGPGSLEPTTEREIANKLRALRADDTAWHTDDEHWSLAGGQGKFTLALSPDDAWALAHGSAPSTHIVKPGISRIRAQALAEHVSMRALAGAGLDVSPTRYLSFEDQAAIVVERYDRRRTQDGRTVRLHQEDLVQTFGLDPRRKYEQDGGPGVGRIADRLRAVAGEDSVDRFVDATIANYLLGAPDGHAKNYSLLLIGASARLAPLYDVSTGLIADIEGRLPYGSVAMSIGGEKRFGEVEAKHWEKFAGVVGRDVGEIHNVVERLAEAIPDTLRDAIADLPSATLGRQELLGEVLPRVAALDRRTVQGLTRSRPLIGRTSSPFLKTLEPASSTDTGPADPGTDAR